MTAPELLTRASTNGVQLWREGGLLRYQGAAADVDPLLPDLARFKLALLELLDDDTARARQRVRPDLARRMDKEGDGADVIELGRLLLKLDAGEEIE